MLDGFPRTTQQAQDLDWILKDLKQPLDYVLYLESTLSVIIQRLTGRRVCRNCGALFHMTNKPPKKEGVCNSCGGPLYQRADDNEETIRTRMDVYLKNTTPIIDYYEEQGKLRKVNADRDAEEVQAVLMKIFHEDRKLNQD
jgi:adenylate kinase